MTHEPPNTWSIVERRFDPASAKAYEGLFTIGSGYLHLRGSLEEHLSGQPQNVEYIRRPANVTSEKFREVLTQWGTYVPGVFARHPLLNNQMVNLPSPLELAPVVDGERLDMLTSRVLEYRRELSLRTGVLRRSVVWQTASGVVVRIGFERLVCAVRPHLVLQRITIAADRACRASVVAGIDADVRTNGHWHFAAVEAAARGDTMHCAVATDAGDHVVLDARVWAEGQGNEWSRTITQDTAACSTELAGDLTPGSSVTVHKRTWVGTSRDLHPAEPRAFELACAAGYDDLLAEHEADWARRWASCDVRVEGDDRAQLAIRASIFHLLRSHVPGDDRVAIDAKGYAGEAYWGRYFWDTEIYLLPFFAYTDPGRARTLADFRMRTLAGARRNAARYGYPGARFAWESDHLGDECCPNWQYADHEVHVTAGVAYGLRHYAAAAGDEHYLRGPAANVIIETARYWMERITFDDRSTLGNPRLLGVMGPDEYKPITHDNAYTNRMVACALSLAADLGEHAGATPQEIAAWRTTAASLPVRRGPGGLVMQCEGFERLADPEFDRFWKDRSRTFAAQVSQERLYRSKCLKQADVLMLMALRPQDFTEAEMRTAWTYYLPYTSHDSSLSAGVHCLIACRLGLADAAWNFWERGSCIDLPEADGGVGWAAEGIHIAAAGAVWQMAVMGFAGLRSAVEVDEVTLLPALPACWKSLSFPLAWKGQRLDIHVTGTGVRVRNRSDRSAPVTVRGVRRQVAPGAEETFA